MHPAIPIWKTAPFLRILPPLIAGILLQWYLQIDLQIITTALICLSVVYVFFSILSARFRFKMGLLRGIIFNWMLLAAGALLSWQKDVRHYSSWYGNYYYDSSCIVVHIDEPVVEKTKSYKADAYVEVVINNGMAVPCKGKLLLYFSKDSAVQQLHYGDKILISKKILPIKNSGNPGAFNYQRYAAFQQTFHNVFLKEKDWTTLPGKNVSHFRQFLFAARQNILAVLKKNINTGRDELGIAEALLIGYTNDLDKDLVQAYSNTGVVHIIAISGMHLGLIYVLLVFVFSKISFVNKSRWLQVLLILGCLWLFSLLTGGAASVLRSAVMFSFITIGKTFFKKASTFNSLAASAFAMLCYNPYYLWDVGFQLSYLAVVGIVVFQKPVYNLLYIEHKWVDNVWKMMAITVSAQVLTFPVCIYYFHQFPLLFLLTNLFAVPLSTVILYAEIFLTAFAWIPFVGMYAGKATAVLVWLMNKFILLVNELPFAVWDKIPADIFTTWLLYATVMFAAGWLLNKNKKMLQFSLIALAGFVFIHGIIGWRIKSQHKLIVYNVPQHRAIDFVYGNSCRFVGDSVLLEDGLLQNFHLKPGRIAMQLTIEAGSLPELFSRETFYQFGKKKILLLDKPMYAAPLHQKINVDIIVVSKSPQINISQLAKVFSCHQFIFDASNSLWKIGKWKEDCDKLNLRHHSIPEQGAFVMDIEQAGISSNF
jgi:competence protein ComEC